VPASSLSKDLHAILTQYGESFSTKTYDEESDEHDVLMDVFGITPALKRENRQYWGRELGMCWERLLTCVFRSCCSDYAPGLKSGKDTICDLRLGRIAVDAKYRIGSGDAGTLKKFKQYGKDLAEKNLEPVMLILHDDSLPAALSACKAGGWGLLSGKSCFAFVEEKTGWNLLGFLNKAAKRHEIKRAPRTP